MKTRLTERDLNRIVRRVVNESTGSQHDVISTLAAIHPDPDYSVIRRLGGLFHDKISDRDDINLFYTYIRTLKHVLENEEPTDIEDSFEDDDF